MTYDINTTKPLKILDLQSLALTPPPKYVETRGYLYIVQSSVFPDHIKIGRTSEPYKRLQSYNKDQPFNTFVFVYITDLFSDVITAETAVIAELYKETAPTTNKKEWFEKEHKEKILYWLKEAEEVFDLE